MYASFQTWKFLSRQGGRERGREGGREGGKEGGREGGKEGGREGRYEGKGMVEGREERGEGGWEGKTEGGGGRRREDRVIDTIRVARSQLYLPSQTPQVDHMTKHDVPTMWRCCIKILTCVCVTEVRCSWGGTRLVTRDLHTSMY